MRSLHDEATHGGNGKVETLDGIRLPREGGWVLVLPDATEASVNIWAEGTSDEQAGALRRRDRPPRHRHRRRLKTVRKSSVGEAARSG